MDSTKTFPNLALIVGGSGEEAPISRLSGKFINNTIAQLSAEFNFKVHFLNLLDKLEVSLLDETLDIDKTDQKFELFKYLKDNSINLLIPWVHGAPGENGQLQALFDLKKIKYLGSSFEAHLMCWNKAYAKQLLSTLDIPTTPFICLSNNNIDSDLLRSFFNKHNKSVFVKPCSQGSSFGCTKVSKLEDLDAACEHAFKFSNQILIEKAVNARELEFVVIETEKGLEVLGPGEIILKQEKSSDFYSYTQKYSNSSQATVSINAKGLPNNTVLKIKEEIKQATTFLGIKDFARFDYFYLSPEEYYLNEINTIPGCTSISMFPKLIEAEAGGFKNFIKSLIIRKL